VSAKRDKTITVKVDRVMHHPVYDKLMRMASKFKAHDEKNSAKIGDTVRIEETRPMSKTKRWRLVEIVKKGEGRTLAPEGSEPEAAKIKTRKAGHD
jgi:small subunit ribosomal protein S17